MKERLAWRAVWVIVFSAATIVEGGLAEVARSEPAPLAKSRLFSRIYGCEAAAAIANSMGDVTEGSTYLQIEARWGFVDRLLPQDKKERQVKQKDGSVWVYHAHHRPPGMTEDGMERHRLMTSAILKKGGRITIHDLAETWKNDIDPSKFGYLLGPQDRVIYETLKKGVAPYEVGRSAAWPGFIGTSKMMLPVGIVNACNPRQAAQDAFELGRLKDSGGVEGNYALEVASAVAAAGAEALKPAATVDSVIAAALAQLSDVPRKEVEQGLHWAREAKDWKDVRPKYEETYKGRPISNAVEVLSGGLVCFYLAKGQPREAILYAVNFGRDTDCKAYIAGGLAGALRGIEAVPADWVKIVEEEVVNDPYTVSRRTAREAAEGLYRAVLNELNQMKETVRWVEEQR